MFWLAYCQFAEMIIFCFIFVENLLKIEFLDSTLCMGITGTENDNMTTNSTVMSTPANEAVALVRLFDVFMQICS